MRTFYLFYLWSHDGDLELLCVSVCRLCSNLKKCEDSVTRVQAELEDNQKAMAELAEQLKKLEDEAGEVMQACQEAEVGSSFLYFYS